MSFDEALPDELKDKIFKVPSRTAQAKWALVYNNPHLRVLDNLADAFVRDMLSDAPDKYGRLLVYICEASESSSTFWSEKKLVEPLFSAPMLLVDILSERLTTEPDAPESERMAIADATFFNVLQLLKALAVTPTPVYLSVTHQDALVVEVAAITGSEDQHDFSKCSLTLTITSTTIELKIDSIIDSNFSLGSIVYTASYENVPDPIQKLLDIKPSTTRTKLNASNATPFIQNIEDALNLDTLNLNWERNVRPLSENIVPTLVYPDDVALHFIYGIASFLLDIGIPFRVVTRVFAESFTDRTLFSKTNPPLADNCQHLHQPPPALRQRHIDSAQLLAFLDV